MMEMLRIMLMKAKDQKGVTAIEYGLLAALIAVGIIVVAGEAGTALQTIFTTIKDALVTAAA